MPAPVSTRGLQRLYKYTLFGFSRKGGGGLPPESKQNGFSQIAKPSEGQGGRTRATDPETRCPSLQRHGLHRALSHQLLSFCYSSLPTLSSCPPFLQPGLQVLPPPCQPPPISPGRINHLPLEDSAVTPLNPPVHIHPPTHHQKQPLFPPGAWPSRH